MPAHEVSWSTRLKLSLLAGGLTATLLALASEVAVLRTEPLRPHVRLGEVLIDASVDPAPPIAQVEEKLCEEAAKLGGDAAVVVYDHIQPVGAYVNGPLWARDVKTIEGRKLKAIVIKYR
ncbi:hypothetical protein [Pseudomonas fluorescens]|uniref:Uncharacterized protein n=1 Tax=Pseudomonas fluorescens TaxID=294 RepID=A0A5E7F9W8_PSEFL|nr:hypothetical protein [Pseudomonas fluorescens]VVO35959.1 hypothetical protein PS833_05381 [Pseudomonas fluorescens]